MMFFIYLFTIGTQKTKKKILQFFFLNQTHMKRFRNLFKKKFERFDIQIKKFSPIYD